MPFKLNPFTGKLDQVNPAPDLSGYTLLAGRSGGQTIIGGTGVTDVLKLQGTSENGTLTSPAIQALVGNNGATVAYTVLNNGNVGIGTTGPGAALDVYGSAKIGKSVAVSALKTLDVAGNLSFDQVTNPAAGEASGITLTENLGVGTLAAGTYYYTFGFITAEGETSCAVFTNYPSIIVSANSSVTVGNVPTSPDPRVTGRRIFRTNVGGAAHLAYSIGTIANNTGSSFIDTGFTGDTGNLAYNKPNTTAGVVYIDSSKYFSGSPVQTSFGFGALQNVTSGTTNAAFGSSALAALTTGSSNVGLGHSALNSVTTGSSNIGINYASGQGNRTGSDNISIGLNALRNNSLYSYSGNIAIGGSAGYTLAANNNYNTFIGNYSGRSAQGNYSVFMGYMTGDQGSAGVTVGEGNIVLGSSSGNVLGTGAHNILLGYDVELAAPNTSNQLNIGNVIYATGLGTGSTPSSTGKVGIGITSPTAVLNLKAGTATASTAPLKFTAGVLNTTAELGAVEFVDDGTTGTLYITLNVGGTLTRKAISLV